MNERAGIRPPLTLDQIKADYPVKEETFSPKTGKDKEVKIISQVYRNPEGMIVYVVPGSTKVLERKEEN